MNMMHHYNIRPCVHLTTSDCRSVLRVGTADPVLCRRDGGLHNGLMESVDSVHVGLHQECNVCNTVERLCPWVANVSGGQSLSEGISECDLLLNLRDARHIYHHYRGESRTALTSTNWLAHRMPTPSYDGNHGNHVGCSYALVKTTSPVTMTTAMHNRQNSRITRSTPWKLSVRKNKESDSRRVRSPLSTVNIMSAAGPQRHLHCKTYKHTKHSALS